VSRAIAATLSGRAVSQNSGAAVPAAVERLRNRKRGVPDVKHDGVGVRCPVDLERVFSVAWLTLEKKHVVVRIGGRAPLVHDERTLEPRELFAHLVDVRMVHERAGARRCEARNE